jgi:hypothetical protein
VQVDVEQIAEVVAEPLLYLRKSPGQVYEALALLPQGTVVVLLTQPVDYQQNEDGLHWVQVAVQSTGEQGWLAYEGLQGAQTAILNGSTVQVGGVPSPGASGTAAAGGGVATSGGGVATSGGEVATSGGGVAAGGGGAAASGGGAVAGGGGAGAVAGAGSAGAGGEVGGAAASLPVALPEFGPTVTPTPTETPTQTPTPMPTALPTATPEPLVINIEVEPSSIFRGECINAEWNILGVKEVYFDYGKGSDDYKPISDNRARSEDVCEPDIEREDGRRYVFLRWKIVLTDGTVREEKKRVLVVN